MPDRAASRTSIKAKPPNRRYQIGMKRWRVSALMVLGVAMLPPANLGAADKPSAIADLQRSIKQSGTALRNQTAQTQAVHAQQRAEGVANAGIGVQVVNPGERAPLPPTSPTHCVTRYSGANVFTDCR